MMHHHPKIVEVVLFRSMTLIKSRAILCGRCDAYHENLWGPNQTREHNDKYRFYDIPKIEKVDIVDIFLET